MMSLLGLATTTTRNITFSLLDVWMSQDFKMLFPDF
jgi:hypothetical protein